ncbi:nitrogenase iron-molybdenum cofactor biosynthesis protein NifN [Pararhodospirillum photometricum]|nr:nitrogenase iron-molybdenum cofactor biosynthesis protein NifN [Pararhodospirillum photometricum]
MSKAFTLPRSGKALSVSPLKLSAPLGAALALMGIDRCLPCLHGTQGCTAFALVMLVRHFREAIPLQTTAMSEISTILGGRDNIEQALLNIQKRAKPRLIPILTTALTETRGEDMTGDLAAIRTQRRELDDTEVVLVHTPDFSGSLELGWSRAVTALIDALVPEDVPESDPGHINVLAGAHLGPGDVEELKSLIEAFGLTVTMLPDLSVSLDGHVPDAWSLTTLGGTTVEEIKVLGRASATLVIGEHMRTAGDLLEARTGVPSLLFESLTGLAPTDRLMSTLAELSGRPVPAALRRQRSRLVDALMDAHFSFGGTRVALAGEPDFVMSLGPLLTGLGARLQCVVVPVDAPHLAGLEAHSLLVGDLEDLGQGAVGCDLMIASTNGQLPARRAQVPLFRAGFPVIDRLGVPQRLSIGYRGTRDMVYALGNALIDAAEAHHAAHDAAQPDLFSPLSPTTESPVHERPADRPQAALG